MQNVLRFIYSYTLWGGILRCGGFKNLKGNDYNILN